MPSRVFLILASLLATGSACAQCVAQTTRIRPHLVELYTSEGCSSCPPAERWLQGARGDDDVVALEFHVDYWDYQGWRDRFDSPRYTTRQRELARRSGKGIIFTPEVALDGRVWPDWYRHHLPENAVAAPATMKLAAEPGSPLHVHVDTQFQDPRGAAGFRNYVALIEDGLVSHIGAGENRGKRLQHDDVVRSFAGPLPLVDNDVTISVLHGVDMSKTTLVAFAQRQSDGAIAQVVRLPMAICHRSSK